MFGNENTKQSVPQRNQAPLVQVPQQTVSTAHQDQTSAQNSTWAFIVLGILYFVWAMVDQHEKVKNMVKPSNLAFNFRTIGLVLLTVIVGMNVLKITLAKLIAWTKAPILKALAHVVGNV